MYRTAIRKNMLAYFVHVVTCLVCLLLVKLFYESLEYRLLVCGEVILRKRLVMVHCLCMRHM